MNPDDYEFSSYDEEFDFDRFNSDPYDSDEYNEYDMSSYIHFDREGIYNPMAEF